MEKSLGNCPICEKSFYINEIETHVNKCIFLNCKETKEPDVKRKRSPSPNLLKSNGSHSNKKTPVTNSKLAPLFQKNPHSNNTIDTATTSHNVNNVENTNKIKDPSFSISVPLAKQMQPKQLADFFGQDQVLGKDSVLRNLLDKGEIPNMILWGPPGCGKTSLASIIQEICKKNSKRLKFVSLCAATCGVKEVQNFVTIAKNEQKFGRKTVLFMDEIHRFNKKQQDTFLVCVEKGEITLIGATTENPSFFLNSALLSRCRVVVLEKLQSEDLFTILQKTAISLNVDILETDNPCPQIGDESRLAIEDTALQWLADISDGDARIALNNFELTLQHFKTSDGKKLITVDDIKEGIKKSHMLYDRAGEEHYNLISAMHKSIRGSDENAALYWTTRMIVSGENPLYIARRLVRAASEDIGNADPNALQLAVATMQGCQLLGMPESDVLLAQCAIYLARAPKSREADSALANAKKLIKEYKGPQPPVPMHIRNAPTKLMQELGYGRVKDGEEFGFMPPDLKDVNFF